MVWKKERPPIFPTQTRLVNPRRSSGCRGTPAGRRDTPSLRKPRANGPPARFPRGCDLHPKRGPRLAAQGGLTSRGAHTRTPRGPGESSPGAKGRVPAAPARALGPGADPEAAGRQAGRCPALGPQSHPRRHATPTMAALSPQGPPRPLRAGGRPARRPGSPGGAAPGRPRRRPRVPRGPSCCTRSRPPPPWPHRGGGARPDQHRGPAGRERARGLRGWGSRGPGARRTLMPGGRSENGRGRRARGAVVSEAWAGPGRSSCPAAAGRGLPGERPGATGRTVTGDPRSRTRAPERCGVRASPSPARPAAPTLRARAPRLQPPPWDPVTQPRGPRASRPHGGAPRAAPARPAPATSRAGWTPHAAGALPPPGK